MNAIILVICVLCRSKMGSEVPGETQRQFPPRLRSCLYLGRLRRESTWRGA